MRLRSMVLPAVLAFGVTVVAPAQAQAAVECGLVVPTKVVIDAPEVETPMRLTNGCYANQATFANWDLRHRASGVSVDNDFPADVLAEGPDYVWTWPDDAPKGSWYFEGTGAGRADEPPLSQNTAYLRVKYGARLAAAVTRTGGALTWNATATQWSGRSDRFVHRGDVRVGVFHQPTSRSSWTFVKSVRTSSTGRATVSVARPEPGNYRLIVGETPTVWAAYSRTVAGRR